MRSSICSITSVVTLAIGLYCSLHFAQDDPLIVSSETTILAQPLGRDGRVDFVSAVNEHLSRGITPDNNAIAQLARLVRLEDTQSKTVRRCYKLLGVTPPGNDERVFQAPKQYVEELGGTPDQQRESQLSFEYAWTYPWDDKKPEFSDVKNWLENEMAMLDKIVAASRCEFGFQPVVGEPGYELQSSQIVFARAIRDFARGLLIRANHHFYHGRIGLAFDDLAAVRRLAVHAARGHLLVQKLVGLAVSSMANGLLVNATQVIDAEEQQWRLAAKEYFVVPNVELEKDWFTKGERFLALEVIQNLSRGQPVGTQFDFKGPAGPPDWNETARYVIAFQDRLIAVLEAESWREKARLNQILNEEFDQLEIDVKKNSPQWSRTKRGRSRIMGRVITASTVPSLSVAEAIENHRNQVAMAKIAVDLARFRADHTHFPDSLDQLIPDYCLSISVDSFTGRKFIYKRLHEGFRLYCAGADGNDDGGDIETDVFSSWVLPMTFEEFSSTAN